MYSVDSGHPATKPSSQTCIGSERSPTIVMIQEKLNELSSLAADSQKEVHPKLCSRN